MENYKNIWWKILGQVFSDQILTWQVQIRAAAITELNFIVDRERVWPHCSALSQTPAFIQTPEQRIEALKVVICTLGFWFLKRIQKSQLIR